MPIVEIEVGRSKYKIECDPSEEERLTNLASKLNEKVNNISLSLRNVDEKTILVISALMLESDLEEQKSDNEASKKLDLANKESSNQDINQDSLIKNIKNISQKVDKLANKIQDY